MPHPRSHPRQRAAFTLIELLVVIAIIAVLMGLLLPGVMKVMGTLPRIQTSTEIGEMDAALGAFMTDYKLQDPPPSSLLINENAALYAPTDPSWRFLQKCFGPKLLSKVGQYDWNGNGVIDPPYVLQGQQLLVFYLGGIPTYGSAIGMTGFSPNVQIGPANPYGPASHVVPGARRNGPYFNFKSSRLVMSGSFPVYLDPWQVKSSPKPYAFFSSRGTNLWSLTDCSFVASPGPYFELTAAGPVYANPNRYQIISAGQNGMFGGGAWSPASGTTGVGADDQSNFSSKILGAPQQ